MVQGEICFARPKNDNKNNSRSLLARTAKIHSPVGYRAGGNHGSVAGQNAVVVAVKSGVVPVVAALQRSLGAARPDRGVLLALGSTAFVDDGCAGRNNVGGAWGIHRFQGEDDVSGYGYGLFLETRLRERKSKREPSLL